MKGVGYEDRSEFRTTCKCGSILEYVSKDVYLFRNWEVIRCPVCRGQIVHHEKNRIKEEGK